MCGNAHLLCPSPDQRALLGSPLSVGGAAYLDLTTPTQSTCDLFQHRVDELIFALFIAEPCVGVLFYCKQDDVPANESNTGCSISLVAHLFAFDRHSPAVKPLAAKLPFDFAYDCVPCFVRVTLLSESEPFLQVDRVIAFSFIVFFHRPWNEGNAAYLHAADTQKHEHTEA